MSAQGTPPVRVTGATTIDSPDRAEALAERLLDPKRTKPVVVVTAAAGESEPYINVEEIIDAVSELADVYILPTGGITFALSDRLPEKTQVYGGAGRVYPVDSAWQGDPSAAPLRFAFVEAQGPVATEKLITDALAAARAAGLDARRVGATVVDVEGQVAALFAPSRAWVLLDDDGHAGIWQDLLLPGLALDQVFRVGMRIRGALDVEERRIDVSASLRKPGEALVDYVEGAVVLARVMKVDNISAVVELYPGARTEMSATEVTGHHRDRLTTLMSVDEVLTVRVAARGGHDGRGWRLSMLDVEDSEDILAAPSLLPDGPPWLVLAELASESSTATTPIDLAEQAVVPPVDSPPPPPEVPASLAAHPDAVPKPFPVAVQERESLRRQIIELEGRLSRSQRSVRAVQVEHEGFRQQARELHARVQQLAPFAEKARTALRNEKQKSQRLEKQLRSAKAESRQQSVVEILFLDPEDQFRYDVDVSYAHRIPAGDKEDRPRRDLRLGPDFLATLSSLEGADRAKVVAVAVEVITDLVSELDSRQLHPLREGLGPAESDVVRADGARCMRVTLQRNAPAARRLHYWQVGDAIELSRVVTHDDMTP